ncbi:hypothetical protein J6590_043340 [Homalodisca vitripennis]|nr:hypothetical protein J6590_043340 [Homalodisca vitripennis]
MILETNDTELSTDAAAKLYVPISHPAQRGTVCGEAAKLMFSSSSLETDDTELSIDATAKLYVPISHPAQRGRVCGEAAKPMFSSSRLETDDTELSTDAAAKLYVPIMLLGQRVPRKYLPPILYHHKLAKGLAGLQTLVGAAVVTVSSWIYIYSPSLSFRDIPFWSGLPLLLSGLLGLLLLCCCRKDYPGYPLSCCVFSFKVTSLTVSVIAGVGCFCAVMFAVIHLLSLQKMVCEAELDVCICRTNNTSYLEERPYPDLSCPEVENMLTLLLVTSASVNCLGGILVAWYLYLHWSSRYSYVYSQVRTNEINRPMVITNKL